MRKGETVLDALFPSLSVNWFLCRVFVLYWMLGQHSLHRGVVRSYTWGEVHLLLSLNVSHIPVL